MTLEQIIKSELNESLAAQGRSVLREPGVADDDAHVNPRGGDNGPLMIIFAHELRAQTPLD